MSPRRRVLPLALAAALCATAATAATGPTLTVSPTTTHRGEPCTRFAVINPRTTAADLAGILATMA